MNENNNVTPQEVNTNENINTEPVVTEAPVEVMPEVAPVETPAVVVPPEMNVSSDVVPTENNTVVENTVPVQPTVDTTVSPTVEVSTTDDPDAIVNENLKQVEINYIPPSKIKMFFTVVMFILLVLFVVFLPDITRMVNEYKANRGAPAEEAITTGKLECNLKSNTANLDIEYSRVFGFVDLKLKNIDYLVTTSGDATLDAKTLDEMNTKCELLNDSVKGLKGIDVECKESPGKFVERQNFNFESIEKEKLTAAFTEAGGNYPDFELNQNIEDIEKTMNAAGYTCERKK